MALQTQIETDNGLSLENAVLVIDNLNETKQSSTTYQLLALPVQQNQPVQYNGVTAPKNGHACSFRVQVYASENMIRTGKRPVTTLHCGDKPLFTFVPDGDSDLIDQAYTHLQTHYPDAASIDLSDIGVK